jgi:soluble cytochrome b562
MGDEMMRLKHSLENEMEQLMLKMQLTASDLERSINTVQMSSEAALRNFSQTYRDGMNQLSVLLDERLSTASSSSYDFITNATVAFGEDVQLLRQAVSSSASQIQFLVGQDLKSTRGLEELRTGNRRHEGHIQQLTSQLGDFKNQVQDQLNSIRAHFTQTVNEFYNKIVERQNGMSYRLTGLFDDLLSVKNRGDYNRLLIL